MANNQNLKPFTKDNQPVGRKSRKGIPNRATVFKRLLDLKIEVADPEKNGAKKKVSLYEAAALGVVKAAMKGNPRAFQEIQDSLFGKLTDKVEHSGEGGGPIPITIIEPIKPNGVD